MGTHTHAHTHKASVLCTVVQARESILVSDFFFFDALYSVVGAATFIHNCAFLLFISPIKNITIFPIHGWFMVAFWQLCWPLLKAVLFSCLFTIFLNCVPCFNHDYFCCYSSADVGV